MAGTVITLSPRVHVAETERLVRVRLQRDGVAEVAAATADVRQRRQLGRLRTRLAADPGLAVYFADRTDGVTYLTVFPAGDQPRPGWMGEARTD